MKEFVFDNKIQDLCYGCRACEQVCPRNAISMQPNNEGFIYPIIDQKKCIDCGLCEKVCPTQDINVEKLLHPEKDTVYAAWNLDLSARLKSTSGGLFFVLATKVISDGGVVYGAVMDETMTVVHCRVVDLVGLTKLRGSKYVQSDTKDTFRSVKKDLLAGINVLYSGTPCQIAGLRGFLQRDYSNLITIDLVCHGTPSPMIFKYHINYLNNKEGLIKSFLFRDKKPSGWRAYISYEFKSGLKKFNTTQNDFYCRSFYAGWISRESCYICEYSQSKRGGDITLSDFWGGESAIKALQIQRKYGYNLVICNTPKGQVIFDSIKEQIGYIETNMTIAKQGDVRLRHAEEKPYIRNIIYNECEENGYPYIVEKYKYRPSIVRRMIPIWAINLMKELKSRL